MLYWITIEINVNACTWDKRIFLGCPSKPLVQTGKNYILLNILYNVFFWALNIIDSLLLKFVPKNSFILDLDH